MLMDEKVTMGQFLPSKTWKFGSSPLGSRTSKWMNAKELEEKKWRNWAEKCWLTQFLWINGEIKAKEQDHNEATFYQENYQRRRLRGIGKRFSETIYRKFLAFQPLLDLLFYSKRPQNPHHNHRYGIIRKR